MSARVVFRPPNPSNPSHIKRSCGASFFGFRNSLVRSRSFKTFGCWGAVSAAEHETQWVCRSERANVLLRLVMSGQMPQRPGAFAAQFAPETLQRFKDLCRRQDKAYSKVLERLALLYVETDGGILSTSGSVAPPSQGVQKRQVQVESLQNKLLEDLLKRVEILEKKETKMLYELDRVYKELAFFRSGLKAPGT